MKFKIEEKIIEIFPEALKVSCEARDYQIEELNKWVENLKRIEDLLRYKKEN